MKKRIKAIIISAVTSVMMAQSAMAATPEATAKAQQIVATIITPGMTDVQKVQACNDYLKNTTTYFINPAPNGFSYAELNPEDRADGPLLLGRGACMGYSDAFKLLMDTCGIPCTIQSSDAGNHVWNQVSVGGQLLDVDVTWNDGTVSNEYALITPQQMAAKHGFTANKAGTLEDVTFTHEEYSYEEYYEDDGGWGW